MRNICFFGVSANPPTGTLGHQGIVSLLVELGTFDEVWVLPVFAHSFASKRDLAPFHHRVEMSRLAFEKLSSPECLVRVKDTEKDVHICFKEARACQEDELIDVSSTASFQHSSGTAELLNYLAATEPDVVFSMTLGEDTFLDLVEGKWCCREADISRAIENRFIVVRRRSLVPKERSLILDEKFLGAKGTSGVHFGVSHVLELDQPAEAKEVSSTVVRACLQHLGSDNQHSFEETLVDPEVVKYARKFGLYVVGGLDENSPRSTEAEISACPKSMPPKSQQKHSAARSQRPPQSSLKLILLQLSPVAVFATFAIASRFWPEYDRQFTVVAVTLLFGAIATQISCFLPWI